MAQQPTYAELLATVQKQAEEIQKQAETIKLLKRRLRERMPPPSTPTPAADSGGRIKELEDQLEEKTLSIRNASKNALHTPFDGLLRAFCKRSFMHACPVYLQELLEFNCCEEMALGDWIEHIIRRSQQGTLDDPKHGPLLPKLCFPETSWRDYEPESDEDL